jgi:hypothetical protein
VVLDRLDELGRDGLGEEADLVEKDGPTVEMDQLGEQVLAGARLALDHDRRNVAGRGRSRIHHHR